MKKLVAVADKVIVKTVEVEEVTENGLIIPATVSKAPQGFGEVISAGEEVTDKIKEGSTILFPQFGGQVIIVDGQQYRCLMKNEIFCILEKPNDEVK